jgi:hypothetical protein
MPKLIVLFSGADNRAAASAKSAAAGAQGVRFTEVDVRVFGSNESTIGRHKRLESPIQIPDYDGVILTCPDAQDIPVELSALLDALEHLSSTAPSDLANTVFGIVGGQNTALSQRVLRLGGLVVGGGEAMDPETRARHVGARVATVVGWVRHALSHEHGHQEQGHHHHAAPTAHHHEHEAHDHPRT